MDLANIFSVTLLLVLLSISGVRSVTVTLRKSADKGQLGNNSISLFCDYILSAGEAVLTIDLKRNRTTESGFSTVVSYFENPQMNATYHTNAADLVGRTLATNPTPANRSAILQFSSIKCEDEADYRCDLLYFTSQGNVPITSNTKIVVTATPTFENQSLLYTPSTNLAENQNVTFTCIGNVGREPQGIFSWYKYVVGQPSGMPITNGINRVSLTSVAGSCTFVRTEKLTLNLTKEDNQMVIRCTVQQTTMSEIGEGNIQTDRISVYYAPRINPIGSDPDHPTYSEGLALLILTCNADSNPQSNYVWTLPDGTVQTGYQLRLTSLTTNHTGRYTCMAYTVWGGQNYTANNSISITVVQTTTPPPTTTIEPRTQKPWPSTDMNSASQQNAVVANDCISSALFKILFGVVVGVSVVLVAVLSICLYIHRKMAAELKHQLQNSNYLNPCDGHCRTLEGSQQYENLERTLKDSQPYDILERTL